MHQSVRDQHVTAAEHLEAEWRLFQAFEAGATGHLCRTWETTRPVSRRRAQHVDRRSRHPGRLPPGCRAGATALLRRRCRHPWSRMSELRPRGVPRFLSGVGGRCRQLQHDSPARIAAALNVTNLTVAGGTDLALNGRKVSGNAQRRGRRALLHHGTLLYAFDASLAARYLRDPHRQPAYRAGRPHTDFLGNLPLSKEAIEDALRAAWSPLRKEFGARS